MVSEENRWNWSPVENGVSVVELFSWKYFLDFTCQEMLDYESYIWRGQRNEDWKLNTTLDRLIETAQIAKTEQPGFIQSHFEKFKYAARGRRGFHPPEISNENDWWALGQHHGLATPLLDWTSSPFVGAYFAYIKTGNPQTKNRVVYALHKPSIENKVADLIRIKEDKNSKEKADIASGKKIVGLLGPSPFLDIPVQPEIIFIRPLSDENQRLVNQGGLFSKTPPRKTIEDWIRENFLNESNCILLKILIPDEDRSECLKTLNRMNINHLTLFPDLYGASKFCNLYGEVEQY